MAPDDSSTSILLYHGQKSHPAAAEKSSVSSMPRWPFALMLGGSLATTTISSLLLSANNQHWTFSDTTYGTIIRNRASVQLIVQLVANALALIWISIVCTLINYATRIHSEKRSVSIDTLRLWHGLCSRTIFWSLPLLKLLVLFAFVALTAIPAAIWAGAITPVATTVHESGRIGLPRYRNMEYVREYGSEVTATGPTLRTRLGLFTYSVGVQLQASLLASASAATPVDGRVRLHQKFDYTGYNYWGRSYGVGSSVGLADADIVGNELRQNYSFVETGLRVKASCTLNETSDLQLQMEDDTDFRWAVIGFLPNSPLGGREYNRYAGDGNQGIVAISVSFAPVDSSRVLAITAGRWYAHLDKMQCTLDFVPTSFNVSVAIESRNITVTPTDANVALDFDKDRLTHVITRQFSLISADQTNIYISQLGQSLNSSIADYALSQNKISGDGSLANATPTGLENAIEAVADDMLVAYSTAQLMIAKDSIDQNITIAKVALQPGARAYIRASFGINVIVILLLVIECARTRFWRGLREFNYMDPAHLILEAIRPVESESDVSFEPKASSMGSVVVSRNIVPATRLDDLGH